MQQTLLFAICAPKLRVGCDDLRPSALSYHGYLAAISLEVQSVECRGNEKLTLDDTIYFDQGMKMGRLTFDHCGRRTIRESAPPSEREACDGTSGWCAPQRKCL